MDDKVVVLVVDDEPKNVRLLQAMLLPVGYDILTATNGVEALESVNKTKPDLILLDIMMPKMDGYKVCEHINSDEDLKDIPIIFLTAKADVKDIVKGFDVGAVDYVTKPFKQAELVARVKTHVGFKLAKDKIIDLNRELSFANDQLQEWNVNLEGKLDARTKEIHEINKALLRKNKILECRDRISEFLISYKPYDETIHFILSELLNLMQLNNCIVYTETDNGEFKSNFGLAADNTESPFEETDLEKYPLLPGLSNDQKSALSTGKDRRIKDVNDYSKLIPLMKSDNHLGYLLLDNTANRKEINSEDVDIAVDFSNLLGLVLNDHKVRGSIENLEDTVEVFLENIQNDN